MIRFCAAIATLLFAPVFSFGAGDPLAAFISSKAVHQKGICLMPRCGEGKLALTLARAGFLVVAMDTAERIETAKKTAIDAGVFGRSLYVQIGTLSAMPLADNSIDLIVIADASKADLTDTVRKEILRVLSPCIGRAIIGRAKTAGAGELDKAALENWVKTPGVEKAAVLENDLGLWATFGRSSLEGADDWTHWFHGADNNPASTDKAFTAPFQLGWTARPFFARSRLTGGRVAAHGRIFDTAEMGGSQPAELTARNAYNGTIIWKRELLPNYRALTSTVIAEGDVVYLSEGSAVLCLDAATGKEIGKIDFSQAGAFLKWIGMSGGKLVGLGGSEDSSQGGREVTTPMVKEKKWGFGTGISAYDLTAKKIIWTWKEPAPIDCRMIGICEERVFFNASGTRVGCLNLNDGKLLWTNDNPDLQKNIEDFNSRYSSQDITFRPGLLCTKEAVCFSCSEKNSLVALSTRDGSLLWSDPADNSGLAMPLYRDGKMIVTGVKLAGSLDAVTGKATKSADDIPSYRGGCGTTTLSGNYICLQVGGIVYDFINKKRLPMQPLKGKCSLGTYISQGMYFCQPTVCRCRVMRGYIAQAPIKSPVPDPGIRTADRLEIYSGNSQTVTPLKTDQKDWPTYRGGNSRTGATVVCVPEKPGKLWAYDSAVPYPAKKSSDEMEFWPTPPVTENGLVFYGGADGRVTCLDVKGGKPRWIFFASGAILAAPTVWEGRVFVGSADGFVYSLEATTGRLIWRFRAAPAERNIMVYGFLQSSWPVNTGVLVEDGTAYFAAGLPLQPKAAVFALDAVTGKIKWQNDDLANAPAGYMTVFKGKLWLRTFFGGSGGAVFDLKDGKMGPSLKTGGLRGRDIGVFKDRFIVYGGNDVYRDTDLRVGARDTKFSFLEVDSDGKAILPDSAVLALQVLAPVWNDHAMILCGNKTSERELAMIEPQCWDVEKTMDMLSKLAKSTDISKAPGWQLNLMPNDIDQKTMTNPPMRTWGPLPMDLNSMVLAGNAVVMTSAVKKNGKNIRVKSDPIIGWKIGMYKLTDGSTIWEENLPSEPEQDGLCIDRDGNILVTLRNGGAVCYGK